MVISYKTICLFLPGGRLQRRGKQSGSKPTASSCNSSKRPFKKPSTSPSKQTPSVFTTRPFLPFRTFSRGQMTLLRSPASLLWPLLVSETLKLAVPGWLCCRKLAWFNTLERRYSSHEGNKPASRQSLVLYALKSRHNTHRVTDENILIKGHCFHSGYFFLSKVSKARSWTIIQGS